MQKLKSLFQASKDQATRAAVVAGTMAAPVVSFAAGEGDDAVSQMGTALTTVGAIGGAALAVYVSIKVFKMIRAAL